jgi:hypothetical protein
VLRANPGAAPVFVRWSGNGGGNGSNGHGTGNGGKAEAETRLKSRTIMVTPSDGVLGELRELLGAERVRLVKP